ncbi:MAG: hypothetical protein V2A73_12355 [Pseudomonadota bacterium]
MNRRVALLGLLSALASASCSGQRTAYHAVRAERTEVAVRVGAYYEVAPRGSVMLASFGTTHLGPRKLPAVHARIDASNLSNEQWQIDVRRQVGELPGIGQVQAGYVTANSSALPVVDVPPGAARYVDLYFLLPRGTQTRQLPSFQVSWVVQTSRGPATAQTPFNRMYVSPRQYAYARPIVYGSSWWYEPGFINNDDLIEPDDFDFRGDDPVEGEEVGEAEADGIDR